MSFASIFGSAGGTESGSAADGGSTSVQLQSAGESAPTACSLPAIHRLQPRSRRRHRQQVLRPRPSTSTRWPGRLYEPLSARLRAEPVAGP